MYTYMCIIVSLHVQDHVLENWTIIYTHVYTHIYNCVIVCAGFGRCPTRWLTTLDSEMCDLKATSSIRFPVSCTS